VNVVMKTILCRFFLVLAFCLPGALQAQQPPPQQSGPPVRDNSKFVVFIHAGGKKVDEKKIREIAVELLKKRYVVRAPEYDQDEIGGPGVDYFAESARDAAKDVADTVNEKLKSLELVTDNKKNLVPRLQRVRNPPGYLGVWLF
jgi:hypothetical protein